MCYFERIHERLAEGFRSYRRINPKSGTREISHGKSMFKANCPLTEIKKRPHRRDAQTGPLVWRHRGAVLW